MPNPADPHWQQLLDLEPDIDDPASHPEGTYATLGERLAAEGDVLPPKRPRLVGRVRVSDEYRIELIEGGW